MIQRAQRLLIALCVVAPGIAPRIALAQSRVNSTNALRVEIGSKGNAAALSINAVKARAGALARVTSVAKRRILSGRPFIPISFPARVSLTRNGLPVQSRSVRGSGDITLAFDAAPASTAFTSTYQQELQADFAAIQNQLDLYFGMPIEGGTVYVRNYDATISDRDAVAGGYYVPDNGSGQREIRFPVYNAPEVAAVNFTHTLLLAYQGQTPYAYDAFEEGLVRAVTAVVMRQNLISGLDSSVIEEALDATYDVQGSYDWYNQRALGGPVFIAPNIANQALDQGVSNGGLYLMRYRMASTAWQKVLTEYPLFAAGLNSALGANAELASDVPGLISAAQAVITGLRPGNATVEGLAFSDWFKRQFILETSLTVGNKLEVIPTPIDPVAGTSDFGVFSIEVDYFQTDSSGNETLVSLPNNPVYPIYWDNFFNRFSPGPQDDTMVLTEAYGAVAPNFPGTVGSGQPYRVAVDVPVSGELERVYLPAGAIATGLNTSPNNFYGTVTGVTPSVGNSVDVKVFAGGSLVGDAPVVNDAFGISISSASYNIASTIEVQVVSTVSGVPSVVLDRIVDKPQTGTLADQTVAGLGLDLRVSGESTFPLLPLPAGLNALGFPIDPFQSNAASVLTVDPAELLWASFDGSTNQYDLSPSAEPFKMGHGYFVTVPSATTVTIPGRSSNGVPRTVALQPGWNLVANPLAESLTTSSVSVIHAADQTVYNYSDVAGALIGLNAFGFISGQNDPATNAPETGSFSPITSFDPGQAYFVQCLAPEGVTLLFTPTSIAEKRRPATRSIRPAVAAPQWLLDVHAIGVKGEHALCELGMSGTATNGFDRAEDSLIPPSVGGLQITSKGSGAFYRDMRPLQAVSSYTLTVDGLHIGQGYTLMFEGKVGAARRTTLRSNSRNVLYNIRPNSQIYFVASARSQTFTLTVQHG